MNQDRLANLKKAGAAAVAVALFAAGCSQGSDSGSSASNAPATPPAASAPPAGGTPAAATGASGTWASVSGILSSNCAPCHSGARMKAGLDVSSYDSLMKGSEKGPVIVAGKPDDSLLVKAITGAAGVRKMPPRGALAQPDIDSIKAWVQAGAKQS